ncbi:hypothetical protein LTR78_008577 [Recurvomyces mirabilis]|uniref:Uncharacterized protein n=2 Tax=Recurvomyces mirabilis TaxID=574656 RepID=A0AAE0TSX9_9PEZI|nr:hypothetical protein LTR78_008577 [Recurvomyces mirabilis]
MAGIFATPESGIPTPTPEDDMDDQEPQQYRRPKRRLPSKDYSTIRQNERCAIRAHLDKCLANPKTHMMASNDLETYLMLEFEKKLTERERKGLGTTRSEYPNRSDPADDKRWIRKVFALRLELNGYAPGQDERRAGGSTAGGYGGYGYGEGVDDDEPGITTGTRKRALPAGFYDEDQDSEEESQHSGPAKKRMPSKLMSDILQDTPLDGASRVRMASAGEMKGRTAGEVKPTLGVACSRSVALLSGRNRSLAHVKPAGCKLTAATRGCVANAIVENEIRSERRHWRWVNGMMVVWPAFERI